LNSPALFDRFERIFIVSLPERKDRRREMTEQLKKVGLANDPRVQFFDAVRPTDRGRFGSVGANGCFSSHLQILQKSAGSSVLILEDDCDFTDAVRTASLPDDFDIFYGGYLEASDPSNLNDSNIIGSHFMGFNAASAQKAADYLNGLLADKIEHDPRAVKDPTYDPQILPPIDGAYVWFRRAHHELNTIFAEPQVAMQRPSRTDIGDQKFYDRIPVLRGAADWARRLKRKLR